MVVDILNYQINSIQVELLVINNYYERALMAKIDPRVRLHLLNRKVGSKNPLKIVQLNYKIFQIAPDILHCHDANIMPFVKVFPRKRACLTVHGFNRPVSLLFKYGRVFSISNSIKQDIIHRRGPDSHIIYNGIDFSRIRCSRSKKLEGRVFRILQVGRLIHQVKGQHILIQAIKSLVDDHGFYNFIVTFIGDGPSSDYLQQLVIDLGMDDHVEFLGLRDRQFVYDNLGSYDLLVQPSIHEGFGLTIVEAMAAKVPVLIASSSGPLEITGGGKYGFTFESGDIASCSISIFNIIKGVENGSLKSVIEDAFDYAAHRFSITDTSDNYINQYKLMATESP